MIGLRIFSKSWTTNVLIFILSQSMKFSRNESRNIHFQSIFLKPDHHTWSLSSMTCLVQCACHFYPSKLDTMPRPLCRLDFKIFTKKIQRSAQACDPGILFSFWVIDRTIICWNGFHSKLFYFKEDNCMEDSCKFFFV